MQWNIKFTPTRVSKMLSLLLHRMPGHCSGHGARTYQGCWHYRLLHIWLPQCRASHRKVITDNGLSNFNNRQSKNKSESCLKLFIVVVAFYDSSQEQTQRSNIFSSLVSKDNSASLIFSIITCLFCPALIQNPRSKFIRSRFCVSGLLSDDGNHY